MSEDSDSDSYSSQDTPYERIGDDSDSDDSESSTSERVAAYRADLRHYASRALEPERMVSLVTEALVDFAVERSARYLSGAPHPTSAQRFFESYLPHNYGGPPSSEPDDGRPFMINFELFPRSYTPIAHLDMERAREVFLAWMEEMGHYGNPCPRETITCSECGAVTNAFVLWTRVECNVSYDVVRKCVVCYEKVAYPLRQKLFASVAGDKLGGVWSVWWSWPGESNRAWMRPWLPTRDVMKLYYELLQPTLHLSYDHFASVRDFLEARAANLIKRWLRFRLEEYSLRPGNAGAKKAEAHFYELSRDLCSPRSYELSRDFM